MAGGLCALHATGGRRHGGFAAGWRRRGSNLRHQPAREVVQGWEASILDHDEKKHVRLTTAVRTDVACDAAWRLPIRGGDCQTAWSACNWQRGCGARADG